MANKIPAAAANAEPRPNVKEMTTSVLMPISDAASGLNASARIAMPILVFSTMKRNASSNTSVVIRTTIWITVEV